MRVHEILASVWKASGERDGWAVGRYVIMPDHVHLFARQSWDGAAASAWVRNWRSFSAREINRTLGRRGPVWQRDYFDRWVRSGGSYTEEWNYVRQYPARAGLVAAADGWPHQGEVVDLRW